MTSKPSISKLQVFHDITERKQAEQDLRETSAILKAAMDCSTAGIAIADAPDGRLRYVNPAGLGIREGREKEHSRDITQQLLAFSRRQTVSPRVIDINDVVEKMLKILRRLIGEDIDLAWSPRSGLWSVEMDPTQVNQILANLCVNARDAIADVGRIVIECPSINGHSTRHPRCAQNFIVHSTPQQARIR